MDSPVIGDWSMAEAPVSTAPSRGILWPAYGDLPRGNFPNLAVPLHERVVRRKLHERLDGPPCPAHAPRLEQLGEREQENDCRAFRVLADRDRACDGDRHEHVHVERERLQRAQCLWQDERAARENGDEKCRIRPKRGLES
jgi:hypothetical protein